MRPFWLAGLLTSGQIRGPYVYRSSRLERSLFTKRSSRAVALFVAFAFAASLVIAMGALSNPAHAKTSEGTLVRFEEHDKPNTGLLVLKTKDGNKKFRVSQKTKCEYASENSGGPIPCGDLDKPEYRDQHVNVNWVRRNGKRWASFIHVNVG